MNKKNASNLMITSILFYDYITMSRKQYLTTTKEHMLLLANLYH